MAGEGNTRLEILSGWKEIANYLGKGVRTVQRYEREFGLPVRRPAKNCEKGAVIATKAEIDAWVSARPIRQMFSLPFRALDNAGTVKRLALQAAELKRLREQTSQLHKEVAESRRALRTSIEMLHKALRVPLLDEDPRLCSSNRPTADVLAFDAKKKVN